MILGPLSFLRPPTNIASGEVLPSSALSGTSAGNLSDPYRRFQDLTRSEGRSGLLRGDLVFGGVPFIGMDWGAFAGVVIGTGIATLLIRGAQTVWESRVRPFGGHGEINALVHNWAVTDEDEARGMAANIGRLFLRSIKESTNAYDAEHFQLPYTVDPKDWRHIDERRQAMAGRYVRELLRSFHDFGKGLSILSSRDYGKVYRDFFYEFMDKLFLVVSPLTRWQNPPTAEDLHNLDTFRTVLRREIPVLEAKIEEVPVQQAV